MEKIRIIVLEGCDRTGKGTLLENLKNRFDDFLVYNPVSAEKERVDYKNPQKFEEWIRKTIRKVLDDLYTMSKLNGTDRPIVMDRLLLTDNVFADLFDREHVVEKYFGREIESNFKLTNYIMLWRNPEEYKDRVNLLKENQDFTEKEIDDILSLFNEYKKSDDIVKLIDNTDTPEDILDDFVSTFIEETPKWKLEHDSTTH
jgi:thymidylate kinase